MRLKKNIIVKYIMAVCITAALFSAVLMLRENEKSKVITELQLDNHTISMMETGTIHASFTLPEDVAPEEICWSYGDKDLADWKRWEQGEYTGQPFITASHLTVKDKVGSVVISFAPVYESYQIIAQFPFYKDLMGTYDLAAKVNGQTIAKASVELRPFESYVDYEGLMTEIDLITRLAEQKNQRFIETRSLGQSAEGRDIYATIVAKDQETVDTYENDIHPKMMNEPEKLQQAILSGAVTDYKVPVWINNIHPNEAPGVSAILNYFKMIALEEKVDFWADKTQKNPSNINIDQLLDHVFFILVYTDNPDGLQNGSRANSEGFDLNRDNSYQTQIETQAVTEQIAKWSPITFLDLHGFDSNFLIEPATPPHDPNLEIDLLMGNMLQQAKVMGNAGIAGTRYTDFYIPYEEYKKSLEDENYVAKGAGMNLSWDDLSATYTATFAMHHGAMGFTLEIPEFNEESTKVLFNSCLAAANYISMNKEELFLNQLEIYRRGIENIDNRAVDSYLVNAKNEMIGRKRDGNENFFPEYYVLPVDKEIQKNPLEVYNMIQYLLRNGIKVECSTQDVSVENITYPTGTFVISLHQSERTLLNTVLYDGIDVSDFHETSAEFIQNFHDLRGFDRYAIKEVGVFEGKTEPVEQIEIPSTTLPENSDYVLVRNSNNDAVKVVNQLLYDEKSVIMLTEKFSDFDMGDFVVAAADLRPLISEYFLEVEALTDKGYQGRRLRPVTVMAYGETAYALKKLGFTISDDPAVADVLVNTFDSEKYVEESKPYIAFGSYGMSNVKSMISDFDYNGPEWERYEGVFLADVEQDNLITAVYDCEEYFYTLTGSYITQIPQNAEVLARFGEDEEFFKAGWWPDHERAKGNVLAFQYKDENKDITVFANDLTPNYHSHHQFRLLANAIFNTIK